MRILITEETLYTQMVFRVLVDTMARPGKIGELPRYEKKGPLQLVLETLLDSQVSFAVVGKDSENFIKEISFITGAQNKSLEEADFVIILDRDNQDYLKRVKRGSLVYPETSATLIYFLNSKANSEVSFRITGPGIPRERWVTLKGLSKEEILTLKEINREYPLGVDVIFILEEGKVLSLPRSTRIWEVE